jgi:hypothetical protein
MNPMPGQSAASRGHWPRHTHCRAGHAAAVDGRAALYVGIRTEGEFLTFRFQPANPTFGFTRPPTALPVQVLENEATARWSAQYFGARRRLDARSVRRTAISPRHVRALSDPAPSEGNRPRHPAVTAYNFGGSDHSVTFAADWERERSLQHHSGRLCIHGRVRSKHRADMVIDKTAKANVPPRSAGH